MEKMKIINVNEVYVKVVCDPGVAYELRDHMTFKVPGYQFTPKYKARMWNGNIYLYNVNTSLLYRGLVPKVIEFCDKRGYTYEYEDEVYDTEFSLTEAKQFIKTLNLPFEPYDYQVEAFVHAIRSKRILLLSPTASGKSLIIYLIFRYLNQKHSLIIVPTISLVSQMASDFKDYGYDSDNLIHKVYAGEDKDSDKPLLVSTWQSLFKLPEKYFRKYNVIFGDECLHPDTKIKMADNSEKKIKDVYSGEYVKTFNEKTKKIENKKIIEIHENISINDNMYEIETICGKKLKITGNHKVLLSTGIWKRVDQLQILDNINSIE